jgi:hypothetical protein
VTITESACDALKVHPARPFFTIAVLIFYLCVGSCSLSVIARASEDVQFGDPDVADPAPPSAVGASQPPSPLHFSGSDATAIETTADHERDSASAVPGRGELGERQFADWSQQRRWPPRGMMPPLSWCNLGRGHRLVLDRRRGAVWQRFCESTTRIKMGSSR